MNQYSWERVIILIFSVLCLSFHWGQIMLFISFLPFLLNPDTLCVLRSQADFVVLEVPQFVQCSIRHKSTEQCGLSFVYGALQMIWKDLSDEACRVINQGDLTARLSSETGVLCFSRNH